MALIFQGRAYTGGKVSETRVRVENGTITAIGNAAAGPQDQVIELKADELLLPAAVEGLCALRDQGEAPRDTVETVTQAALSAGVTVVCDQSNTIPRLNTSDLAARRSAFVAERAYADFGVAAHPPLELSDIKKYAAAGVHTVMLFMWDLKPWNHPRDTDRSREEFQAFADHGLPGVILVDELAWQQTVLWEQGETRALEALLRRLPPDFHARLQVTLPSSVETIQEAKKDLPNILVQTPVHSVFMSREVGAERIGSAAFTVPPLKSERDVERMRKLSEAGAIDIIVSHHAGHLAADKYSSAEPIPGELTPKAGYSTIDYTFPLVLTKLGVEAACRMHCEIPAAHLRLKKGKIATGYEADLVVVAQDSGEVETVMTHARGGVTRKAWRVEPADFFSKATVTPFVGERLLYRVMKTFIRGEEAYDADTKTFKRQPVRRLTSFG